MRDRIRTSLLTAGARLRRIERRELRELRRWAETTSNLLHLTVLVAVPLLIGLVTLLSNAFSPVFFLVYPPLAAGTYTLFADPEGRYSTPQTFVGGMVLGALAGWVALEVAVRTVGAGPPGPFRVSAPSAALAVLLTGGVTWLLDLEEPAAFSTALMVLLAGGRTTGRLAYVVGVALSSALVAAAFVVWRDRFYERRARYLYRSTDGDDHVLVPVRGDPDRREHVVRFASALAAAHDAGMVVLLDVVDGTDTAAAERTLLSELRDRLEAASELGHRGSVGDPSERREVDGTGEENGDAAGDGYGDAASGRPDPSPSELLTASGVPEDADPEAVAGALGIDPAAGDTDLAALADAIDENALAEAARDRAAAECAVDLETLAAGVEAERGIPCQVVVADDENGWSPALVERTAGDTGCDLVVSPYRRDDESLRTFAQGLFGIGEDVVAFQSTGDPDEYDRAMVAVRKPGPVANAMIDFARRATGSDGRVSVCRCIAAESQRRSAESMLATLVKPFPGDYETRVANAEIETFLAANAPTHDLVLLGASRDRSTASRLFSPPTFERLDDLDADVAIVHRGR